MTVVDAKRPAQDLGNAILNLSQSKQILARETTAWTLRAPWLEAGITLAKIAQEELGHAQLLANFHADHFAGGRKWTEPVGLKGEIDHPDVVPFAALTASWPEFIALMCFWDCAVATGLETLTGLGDLPIGNSISKMSKDEERHRLFAQGSARELLARGGQVQEAFKQAADVVVPKVGDWLDSFTDQEWLQRAETGPKAAPRERYLDRVGPLLADLKLTWPEQRDAA